VSSSEKVLRFVGVLSGYRVLAALTIAFAVADGCDGRGSIGAS
jgi:hypothetical protein